MYNIRTVSQAYLKYIVCFTQAGPTHAAGHVEIARTDEAIVLP